VANRTSSQSARQRRDQIEALRRQQRAAERRCTLLVIGAAAAVALLIVGAATAGILMKARHDPARRAIDSFGVSAAAAACSPTITDKATGSGVHVGPGTNQPKVTKVKYAPVPPSSGEHFAQPADGSVHFYTTGDRPPVEALVHNLEHGYTVLWYDSSVTGTQLEDLKALGPRLAADPATDRLIVSPWDDSYGAFPAGKHLAMSHWGATSGYRQLCGQLSGSAVAAFMAAHPATDAPEPGAA